MVLESPKMSLHKIVYKKKKLTGEMDFDLFHNLLLQRASSWNSSNKATFIWAIQNPENLEKKLTYI